jgi:hypothetical protein
MIHWYRLAEINMKKFMILVLMLGFLPASLFAEEDEEDAGVARVVTMFDNVTICLASVQIRQIDGKNRMLPSLGFDIEPGWHTMHGSAQLDLKRCPVRDENRRSGNDVHIPPLEWLFEAGKVYYVGLDHSSPMRENWRLIVWKVRDDETQEEELLIEIEEEAT